MLHPNRRINQHGHEPLRARVRRRRTRRSLGSLPPKAANRLALSLAIKASSPARTTAVFSAIPLSRAASLKRASSIFKVVLICINMHHLCISFKWATSFVRLSSMCHPDRSVRNVFSTRILCGWADAQWRDLLSAAPKVTLDRLATLRHLRFGLSSMRISLCYGRSRRSYCSPYRKGLSIRKSPNVCP